MNYLYHTVMNIKPRGPAELQTTSHQKLWIKTSYRYSSTDKQNSFINQNMDARKYFVWK